MDYFRALHMNIDSKLHQYVIQKQHLCIWQFSYTPLELTRHPYVHSGRCIRRKLINITVKLMISKAKAPLPYICKLTNLLLAHKKRLELSCPLNRHAMAANPASHGLHLSVRC